MDEETIYDEDQFGSKFLQFSDSPQTHSTSVHEYVNLILKQINEATYRKERSNRNRQDMEFYQIVLGGNTIVARMVLEHLESNGMEKELTWVLGKSNVLDLKSASKQKSVLLETILVTCYLLLAVLFVILTPVFYIVHTVVHNTYRQCRRRLIRHVDLPLVFAILSENKEMIRLFVEFGTSLSSTDLDGNNIYHYLADLSIEEPEQAIRCYREIHDYHLNQSDLRKTLMENKNYLQLSGLEAICKYGSLQFMHHILEADGCIGKIKLKVSESNIYSSIDAAMYDLDLRDHPKPTEEQLVMNMQETSTEIPQVSNFSVWKFDMGKYENGDIFGSQSYLLHLLTSRSVDTLSEIDTTILIKSKIIVKWMHTKTRQYFHSCVYAHLSCVAVSLLLFCYSLMHGGDMNRFPLASMFFTMLLNHSKNGSSFAIENTLKKVQNNCEGMSRRSVMQNVGGYLNFSTNTTAFTHRENNGVIISLVLLLVTTSVIDLIVRQIFLFKNFNFRANSPTNSILPVVFRWIPGSYAEKQLAAMMACLYYACLYLETSRYQQRHTLHTMTNQLFMFHRTSLQNETDNAIWHNLVVNTRAEVAKVEVLERHISVIYMTCLLLRFLHTIHQMRLFPGLGFFIITTKKMAQDLFKFGLVFVLVLTAFSTMFHLGIRKPQCPALKSVDYGDFSSSIYSTYQVVLGQGEVDQFSYTTNSQVAYIICTVVIILMLLNLIIAVMTTTATDMNTMPWREAVCLVEGWDEILGTEAQVLSMTKLFRWISLQMHHNKANCKDNCRKKRKSFLVAYHHKGGAR